jgi:prepilin peptidase CpaA
VLTGAAILVKAVAVALLLRIAWTDFDTQKIKNRDVFTLAVLGVAGLALPATLSGSWSSLTIGLIAGAVLFIAMLPLWLLRKIGAGDVKLLAVAPLIAGGDYLFAFALLLLFFAVLTALVVKNPLLLPASVFRRYIEALDRKGVVPFGVPISASLIGVLILQSLGTPLLP